MTLRTLGAAGDSQTDAQAGWGVEGWNVWPARLAEQLTLRSTDTYQARNLGLSGDTSRLLLDRFGQTMKFGVPDIGVVAIGVNDPGASITAATTQNNIRSAIMALKHRARGNGIDMSVSVAGQASLPAVAEHGSRYVVESDTSTVGGTAAWGSGMAATVGGTATGPTVWEFRYPIAGEAGWGRIAKSTTPPTAVDQVIVLGAPYLNWTTGGDTPSTPDATRLATRTAQAAAATAENVTVGGVPTVVFADLYALMRDRIVAGTDPDFSTTSYDAARSWHTVQNNQHLNTYGHMLAVTSLAATITSAGWSI